MHYSGEVGLILESGNETSVKLLNFEEELRMGLDLNYKRRAAKYPASCNSMDYFVCRNAAGSEKSILKFK